MSAPGAGAEAGAGEARRGGDHQPGAGKAI